MGLEAFNKVDLTSFQLGLDLDYLRQIGTTNCANCDVNSKIL